MSDFSIVDCGTNQKNDKGYVFSGKSPLYEDCYLFLFFKTEFESATKNGIKNGSPYSYILYKPNSDCYHSGINDSERGFINDWMYIKGEYIDRICDEMNILTDVIVPLFSKTTITDIMNDIHNELAELLPYKELRLKNLVTNLFIEVVRSSYTTGGYTNNKEFNIMLEIRNRIFKDYKNNWTLETMANINTFSVSQFLFLYKKYFGQSPVNDLINHRLSKAKQMIESGNKNMSQIALENGFSTLYYFSRIFKKRIGISPTAYRKKFYE